MGAKRKDELRALGETAVRRVFEMAESQELKPELRLQAYKFVAERLLGKEAETPGQQAAADPAGALSLAERREIIRQAAERLGDS